MKTLSIASIYKRIAALLKSADCVYCDKTEEFFYLSESHTIYKVPVTAETENIFESMFAARAAAGKVATEPNSGNMEKAFRANTDGDFFNYEIIGLMNKSGLLSHAAYLIQHDEKTHKVINSEFLDVFKGFDFSVGAVNLSDKYPAVVHCEPVEAVLLPISMDLETAKKNIARSIEEDAENAKKTKGLFYSCGRDALFIPKGKKDLKTINKIISFLCDKIGADDENREKFYQDSKLHETIKNNCVNVTMEIKNDEAGDYYYLTDTKTFFFFNPVVWSQEIDDGIIKFIVAPEDRAAFNKDQFEADRRPAAAKTETAAEDQEPAEAANDITTEPAENIPADAIQEPTTGPAEAADDPADQEPTAAPEALNIEDITPENYTEFLYSLFGKDNHNASIIMLAGFEAGVYKYPDLINYLNDGTTPNYHTFDHWKNAGYMVKKGEKAAFSADIWKYTEKHGTMTAEEAAAINAVMIDPEKGPAKEGDQTTTSQYILKKSFFFGPAQVEKIEKKPFTAPEGCELKTENGREILTGDTKPHKDAIKNAGFYWHKANNYWYRTA